MKIGIMGAGWYGCHIALVLSKMGHTIEIFEKNDDIFKGVSGTFGIRLHKGPHYPRSTATRGSCQESFKEFYDTYPDLVVQHAYSIYGLGKKDALGCSSKVNVEQFRQVCHESSDVQELKLELSEYKELELAVQLEEPSIVLGNRLREAFRKKLMDANIHFFCNLAVREMKRHDAQTIIVTADGYEHLFDKVINTTGYQACIPPSIKQKFPIDLEAIYQPCLALCYEDLKPLAKPISFIVMDGWFPCLMPYIDQEPFRNNYILTHGNYTIMGSYDNPQKAYSVLNELTDDFVVSKVKVNAEREMCRFWPAFDGRFNYVGWKGTVLVKLKTKTEFRSAVTFEYDDIIYAIPGKVSNIFNAARETCALIENQPCFSENGIRFAQKGMLDIARDEIQEKPALGEPNTCTLNTYAELKTESSESKETSDELKRISVSQHSIFHFDHHTTTTSNIITQQFVK